MNLTAEFTCCAVINEGVLHGVAGIDVIVNSSEAASAISRRIVDPNVDSIPLACQMVQVTAVCL